MQQTKNETFSNNNKYTFSRLKFGLLWYFDLRTSGNLTTFCLFQVGQKFFVSPKSSTINDIKPRHSARNAPGIPAPRKSARRWSTIVHASHLPSIPPVVHSGRQTHQLCETNGTIRLDVFTEATTSSSATVTRLHQVQLR